MQHFVAGPYSGKVIKTHRCIFLGSKDMRKKADWGIILPPPVGHRRVKCYKTFVKPSDLLLIDVIWCQYRIGTI